MWYSYSRFARYKTVVVFSRFSVLYSPIKIQNIAPSSSSPSRLSLSLLSEKAKNKNAMDAAPTSIAPMLNLVTSIFLFADKSLLNFQRYRIIDLVRRLLITSCLFFLRLLPSFIPSATYNSTEGSPVVLGHIRPTKPEPYTPISYGIGDSGIARALSHLLTIVNTMPVSSRKYESVRSLAEKLIDENHQEGTDFDDFNFWSNFII